MSAPHRDEFVSYAAARTAALRRTAFLLCGDWHRAEDIVQTALAKLYVAWPRIHGQGSPDPYVRQIVVRTFLEERRRFWRREVPTETLPDIAADRDTADDRLMVLAALSAVPRRQRATLILRFWEDLTVEQTAQTLGCSEGTVKSQTARGLETLRTHLQRRGISSPTTMRGHAR